MTKLQPPENKRTPLHTLRGFSLVELTLAISITAILSVLVFSVWNQLTLHTTAQQRKTALRSECLRITKQLSIHLHKTDHLISWNSTSLTMTLPPDNDTITYSFNGTELLMNGNLLSLVTPHTKTRDFHIANANEEQDGIPYLFTCLLTLENSAGDTATTSVTVLVRRNNKVENQDSFMW